MIGVPVPHRVYEPLMVLFLMKVTVSKLKLKATINLFSADDTFYLPSGSFDGTTTGQHLYGVFTSSK